MGPPGVGKTEIGTLLAKELGIPFIEGDIYHPNKNIEKMKSGIELTDEDRLPWLHILVEKIRKNREHKGCCLDCSALKKSYRDILRLGDPNLYLIYLKGEKDLIINRMKNRKNHHMRPEMLEGQLAILEEPNDDEMSMTVDINQTRHEIVNEIIKRIHPNIRYES